MTPESVLAEFVAAFGHEPAGVWAAPGRVNLIGEHTDYNDGFVLPLALPLRTLVAARVSGGPSTVASVQEDGETVRFDAATVVPADVPGWAGYVAGVVWAFREAGLPVVDLELLVDGNVPVGAGLSSSAALECAVAVALAELAAATPGRTELARLARRAENDFVGAPTGGMDQMVSLHGEAGGLVFLDTRTDGIEHIPFDVAAQGLELLVIDTRAPHALVDGQYGARRADCARAAELLGVPALRDATLDGVESLTDGRLRRRARHVVTENARVLDVVGMLKAGKDPRDIGPLLTASHASLRDDFEVTVPHLDVAADVAVAAGAYGARMTGGGFGGCVIALCDADRSAAVTAAVTEAYAARGWDSPAAFPAVPSAGAHRLT
ncbi:MAG: galactokinase [Pseudonocardia sp.]|uniref:galactokinase n=1 Tax=Pseudonocardia sp. TaxID=60912 RepID=UPI00260FEE16|nr:galactokinase [Pseudonocardia sp.]MCU1628370.1 galactokinase [Pseudonocardia sp.]